MYEPFDANEFVDTLVNASIIAPLDVVKIRFFSRFFVYVDCRPNIFDMAKKSTTVR